MSESHPVTRFGSLLRDLAAWCTAEQVPHVIIGGVAAALLGRPRLTRDVDAIVLVDDPQLEGFLAAGKQFGFAPRASDAIAFARTSRVLLVSYLPGNLDVDLSLGLLPFEEQAAARAIIRHVENVPVRVPQPEDLLIMKLIAGRPKDLEDARGVVDTQPDLDLEYLRRGIDEFAFLLDAPQLSAALERLVGARDAAD